MLWAYRTVANELRGAVRAGGTPDACFERRKRPYCGHGPQKCSISGVDRNASADDSLGGGSHQDRFRRPEWSGSGDGTSEIAGLSAGKPQYDGVLLRLQQGAVSMSGCWEQATVAGWSSFTEDRRNQIGR